MSQGSNFEIYEGQKKCLEAVSMEYEGKNMSNQPDCLLPWDDWLSGWRKSSGCCLPWLSKAFDPAPIISSSTNWWSMYGTLRHHRQWGGMKASWTQKKENTSYGVGDQTLEHVAQES